MEDEATEYPDGCVWEKDGDDESDSEHEHTCADDGDIEAFGPGDWVNPKEAKANYVNTATETPHHCHGDSKPSSGSCSQDVALFNHQAKMRAYMEASQIIESTPDTNSASLAATVKRVYIRSKSVSMPNKSLTQPYAGSCVNSF